MFNGDGVVSNRIQGYAMVRRAAAGGSAEAGATQSEMELVMPKAELDAALKLAGAAGHAASPPEARAAEITTAAATSSRPQAAVAKGRAARMASGSSAAQPAPKRTKRPETTPQASSAGAWRIQLGAFREPGAGQSLFARLAPRLPGKQPAYVAAGSLLRLQVGPYATLEEASAACRTLGSGQVCVPVRSR